MGTGQRRGRPRFVSPLPVFSIPFEPGSIFHFLASAVQKSFSRHSCLGESTMVSGVVVRL